MSCNIPTKNEINKDALKSKQTVKHIFRWIIISLIFWLLFFYCCNKIIIIIFN
jgi:hypothetical protein